MHESLQEYYSQKQIAEKVGLSLQTVRRYVWEGKIPSYKVGESVRIRIEDFDAWMESNRREKQPVEA